MAWCPRTAPSRSLWHESDAASGPRWVQQRRLQGPSASLPPGTPRFTGTDVSLDVTDHDIECERWFQGWKRLQEAGRARAEPLLMGAMPEGQAWGGVRGFRWGMSGPGAGGVSGHGEGSELSGGTVCNLHLHPNVLGARLMDGR